MYTYGYNQMSEAQRNVTEDFIITIKKGSDNAGTVNNISLIR